MNEYLYNEQQPDKPKKPINRDKKKTISDKQKLGSTNCWKTPVDEKLPSTICRANLDVMNAKQRSKKISIAFDFARQKQNDLLFIICRLS